MGDRVVVTFTNDNLHYSPGVYMHDMGSEAHTLIEQAAPMMRRGDTGYSAARFLRRVRQAADRPPRARARGWS